MDGQTPGAPAYIPGPSDYVPGTNRCLTCGKDVEHGASHCPHCGAPVRPPRNGPSAGGVAGAIVLGLVALFAGMVAVTFFILAFIAMAAGTVEPILIGTALVSFLITVGSIFGIIQLIRKR